MMDKLCNLRSLAWVLAACVWPMAAQCANWSFDPRVEVGGQTDDNYRLLPSGYQQSVSGAFGDLRLDMHTVDPVNQLRFSPGVHATWFPNSSDDDSTDPYAEFFVAHRGLRSTATLTSSYIKETVVRSDPRMTDYQLQAPTRRCSDVASPSMGSRGARANGCGPTRPRVRISATRTAPRWA